MRSVPPNLKASHLLPLFLVPQPPLGNMQAYWNTFSAMDNQLEGPLPPFLTDDVAEQVGTSGGGRRVEPLVACKLLPCWVAAVVIAGGREIVVSRHGLNVYKHGLTVQPLCLSSTGQCVPGGQQGPAQPHAQQLRHGQRRQRGRQRAQRGRHRRHLRGRCAAGRRISLFWSE